MILHGILAAYGTWDNLIHELNNITDFDAKKTNKIISWKKIDKTYNWRVR